MGACSRLRITRRAPRRFSAGGAGEFTPSTAPQSTWNAPGALYALQPGSAPRTPISLSVDVPAEEFSLLRLGRGDPVTCGETLRVGAYLFRASGAAERTTACGGGVGPGTPRWPPCAPCCGGREPRSAAGATSPTPRCTWRGGADASGAAALREGGPGFFRAARAGECAAAAVECASLIGLGAGLTPAGDDFNVGVLAVSWYLESARSRELRGALSREAGRLAGAPRTSAGPSCCRRRPGSSALRCWGSLSRGRTAKPLPAR